MLAFASTKIGGELSLWKLSGRTLVDDTFETCGVWVSDQFEDDESIEGGRELREVSGSGVNATDGSDCGHVDVNAAYE
jgi:hypothetical protein